MLSDIVSLFTVTNTVVVSTDESTDWYDIVLIL